MNCIAALHLLWANHSLWSMVGVRLPLGSLGGIVKGSGCRLCLSFLLLLGVWLLLLLSVGLRLLVGGGFLGKLLLVLLVLLKFA